MVYENIELTVDRKVATLRLNRPERFNSFNEAMHADIRCALEEVRANSALRCLVLTGNGKGFCTGQDLNDRYALVNGSEPIDLGASLERNYNALVATLKALDIPVVCAVNGVAAGAGVSIALACDIVVAAKSAKFVFSFAKVGLVPDAGSAWSLIQSVGLPRAMAMTLLGDTIDASEAAAAGMIWRCVEDGALQSEVAAVVERLLANPALGQSLTKRTLLAATANSLANQLALEAQMQTLAGRSPDYAEAVRAFVEKREPQFTGGK